MLTRQPTSQPAESTELADLYERDYYAWTDAQVHALRERKVSGLDWGNLAEEVEDLGKAERHRLERHLELLLMHFLKWVYQPQRRSRSWSNSIREHEASWAAHWLKQMDYTYRERSVYRGYQSKEGFLPSDYWRRNLFAVFQEDEATVHRHCPPSRQKL